MQDMECEIAQKDFGEMKTPGKLQKGEGSCSCCWQNSITGSLGSEDGSSPLRDGGSSALCGVAYCGYQ